MKTKIVYIVVCDNNNYYLEQALLSIYSLKIFNPNAKAYIVTDIESAEYIEKNILINNTINITEIIKVEVPTCYNKKQKSRFLKTKLRNFINGDYLFIDTDTIICGDISNIDNFNFDIGAVLDTHLPINKHLFREDIEKFAKIYRWNSGTSKFYFNSGVMYVKDTPTTNRFYDYWFKYWIEGSEQHKINIDQPSLAKANEEMGYIIRELNGIYNCQINENGLKYLTDARIIHYFASNLNNIDNSFTFAHTDIYIKIRENGFSDEIISMLKSPKQAFEDKCTIISGMDCNLYRLPINRIATRISRIFPSLNSSLRKLSLLRSTGK